MAFPTAVNSQITDTVAQADAPAVGLANLYQSIAQSMGVALQNATAAEQNADVIVQATVSQGVALLYGARSPTR